MASLAYRLIDGKKVTEKEVLSELAHNYKDPLTIEQDHNIRSYIFNEHSKILFYKLEDSTVKGYFHSLNEKQVYTALVQVEVND